MPSVLRRPRTQRSRRSAARTSALFLVVAPVVVSLLAGCVPRPANDNFANAQVITGASGLVDGTTVNATRETGEPNLDAPSVWYRWTAPTTAGVRFSLSNINYSTGGAALAVFEGTAVNALTFANGQQEQRHPFTYRFFATAGQTYSIGIGGDDGSEGSFTLDWRYPPRPPNDNFAKASPIGRQTGTHRVDTLAATNEDNEQTCGDVDGGHSIWYRYTPPSAGTWQFDAIGVDYPTVLCVYTGTNLGNLQLIAFDEHSQGDDSSVTFSASAPVYVTVEAGSGRSGGISELRWSPVAQATQ
jgi:hypothetical protein